jgi:hypothetical protein
MRHLIDRIAQTPGLTVGCVTILVWVLVGFALADPELSPRAPLGGAKALFVVLGVVMTLLTLYRLRVRRKRD